MKPERFAQIEAAFHRLGELPAAQRRVELRRLHDEDPELALEASRLLEAGDATWKLGDWLRGHEDVTLPEPLYGALPSAGGDDCQEAPERIGGFKILGELGRGGMGIVYLGMRDDDFQQQVALKVVKRGMDTDEILDRMRRERQILATLEHPNIARLIDGGSTEDGRPYFAMEYIEGQTLLGWCASQGLDVAQRIHLFLEICGAVDYAHRNLIIHRDLKPSNILVTESGTAKLLDFGIAKLLASSPELRTVTGQLLLTPEFASPEQVLGEPLTTATDVYSLGVLLYCLLTGVHPYREKLKSMQGLYQFAQNAAVPRASSRVVEPGTLLETESRPPLRSSQLVRALRGDLDNILSMALRREPERRYPSVAELAQDLRRHLDRRPVKAHPETFGYRMGRFVARQRVFVAAGSLVFLSLTAGIAGTSWQARRAEAARAVAEEQAVFANEISDFLIEIFGEPDPAKHRGDEPKARDLLERGRDRLEDLQSQPRRLANLALVIGQAYQQLGDHGEALTLYRRCLDLRRQELTPPAQGLVEALLFLADAEGHLEQVDQAQKHLLEALEQQRQLPEDPATMASLVNDVGANYFRSGALDSAEMWLFEALQLRRQHLGPRHEETAFVINNLAALRIKQGRTEEAAALLSESLGILEEQLDADHPELLEGRANLAAILQRLGRIDEAVAQYRQLITSQRKVYGDDHPALARSLSSLGWTLKRQGGEAEAVELFLEAAAIFAQGPGEGQATHLRTLLGLAEARQMIGESEAALGDYDRVLSFLATRQEPLPRLLVIAHSGRGRLFSEQGEGDLAIRDLCRATVLRQENGLSGRSRGQQDRELLEQLTASPGVKAECPLARPAPGDPGESSGL